MDPITTTILTGMASGVLANFSTEAIKKLFSVAFNKKPELESKLRNAKTSYDFEEVFKDAVGVIDANANTSTITIDGGLLEALRGIRFNHSHGTVSIAGATLSSEVLVTGGSGGSIGRTVIGENTEMRSSGTSISVGKGCSIQITGDASISQN